MTNHERDGSRPGDPDATVTSAWRNASAEQPSSALDRAIIAAAREKGDAALLSEKDKKPGLLFFSRVFRDRSASGHSRARWQPMAAAAAVAGLAFVLVQELPRESEHVLAPRALWPDAASMPAEAVHPPRETVTPPPETVTPPPEMSSREATLNTRAADDQPAGQSDLRFMSPTRQTAPAATPTTRKEASRSAMQTSPSAGNSTAPIPADAGNDLEQAEPRGDLAHSTAKDSTAPAPTSAAMEGPSFATMQAPSPAAREKGRLDAPSAESTATSAWVAKISSSYDSGDLSGAETTLREFRAEIPDADSYLPTSLREWASTVH